MLIIRSWKVMSMVIGVSAVIVAAIFIFEAGGLTRHEEYLKKGVDCSSCHTGVTEGEAQVSQERCLSCHNESEYLERYQDVLYLHDQHVTENKVECFQCHKQIKHGIEGMVPTIAQNCNQCHQAQHTAAEEMYMGLGGEGVESMPAAMFEAMVDCNACHRYPREEKIAGYVKSVKVARAGACDSCHGEGFGKMVVPMWQNPIQGKYSALAESLEQVESILSQVKSSPEKDQAYNLYQKARNNLQLVEADGSWGVHNAAYAGALLDKAEEYLEEVKRILEGGQTSRQ